MTQYRLSIWIIIGIAGVAGLAAQQPGPPGPPPTGTGLILGRVVDAESNAPIPGVAVQMGPGAGSTLPNSVARAALTDAQGRFVFRELPAGAYGLMARMGGNGFSPSGFLVTGIGHPIAPYLPGGYGQRRPNGLLQTLDLADDQRRDDVVIRLWKGGAVDGTVTDESGEPVVGAVVSAVRRNSDGRLTTGPSTRTDDRGAYHIGTLVPGEYVVVVPQTQVLMPTATIDAWSPDPQVTMALSREFNLYLTGGPDTLASGVRLGRATLVTTSHVSNAANVMAPPVTAMSERYVYRSTFAPSAGSADAARPFTIGSGETRTGVDVQLRPVRAVDVSGTLTDASGPVSNFGVHLLPADTGDGTAVLLTATTATDSQGAFTFPLVPAGRYTLLSMKPPAPQRAGGPGAAPAPIAQSRPSEAGGAWANQPVTVADSSVTNVLLTLRAGVNISGRVEYRGSGARPTPEELRPLAVLLAQAEPLFRSAPSPAPNRGAIDGTDRFAVGGNPAGRYVIRVADTPAWRLESVTVNGIDRTDDVMTVGPEDLAGVVITLTDRPAQLSGTVRNSSNGAADQTAAVFMFPVDPRRWPMAPAQTRVFRTARTTTTGTFVVNNVLPGEYLVAAVPDEQAAAWPDQAFIRKLAAIATRHTISPNGNQSVSLQAGGVR